MVLSKRRPNVKKDFKNIIQVIRYFFVTVSQESSVNKVHKRSTPLPFQRSGRKQLNLEEYRYRTNKFGNTLKGKTSFIHAF